MRGARGAASCLELGVARGTAHTSLFLLVSHASVTLPSCRTRVSPSTTSMVIYLVLLTCFFVCLFVCLLKDNCFTEFCSFLLNLSMNQP